MKRTTIPLVESRPPSSAGTFVADEAGNLEKVSDWARIRPAAAPAAAPAAPDAPTPAESETPPADPEPDPAPKKGRKAG